MAERNLHHLTGHNPLLSECRSAHLRRTSSDLSDRKSLLSYEPPSRRTQRIAERRDSSFDGRAGV